MVTIAPTRPLPGYHSYRDHLAIPTIGSFPAPQEDVVMTVTAPPEFGVGPIDDTTAGIERLARVASAVLNKHVNLNGACAVCTCPFPCRKAVLAEHNVALL